MNQAFFTLSLGIAAIEIFGSYMSDDFTLTGEAVRITALDTFVAVLSGLIIFPACFAYNVQPDEGPSLISSHFRAYSRTCPSASSGAHFSLSS